MANVCIVRHQGYIKSKMQFPFQHNFRTLKNYGNEIIDLSLTPLNSTLINNLKDGETYQAAFKRLYESGEFKGQLKVQGAVDKQTKFLEEYLVYPPYEKITKISLEEQEAFFQKELKALKKYFPDIIILSAHIHRDEVFRPLDEEMKALFSEGKVTPHMHVVAIPVIHDKNQDCKKISISELWKGKFSYRKFQDFMYDEVGKEYGFDRGEKHDFGEAKRHLEVKAFKLEQETKLQNKRETELNQKEMELIERAKDIEPEEHVSILNIKKVIEQQKAVNLALKMERDKNALLHKEIDELYHQINGKDDVILTLNNEIQNKQEKLSEVEKELLLEKDRTNDILNIKVSDERLRQVYLDEAKQKIKLFERLIRLVQEFLPILKIKCPEFVRELLDYKILHKEDVSEERENNRRKDR